MLNNDVKLVLKWSLQNGISINSSNSPAIVITRRLIDLSSFPKVSVENINIQYVSKLRNLGLIINEHLSWNDLVGEMLRKINFRLRKL